MEDEEEGVAATGVSLGIFCFLLALLSQEPQLESLHPCALVPFPLGDVGSIFGVDIEMIYSEYFIVLLACLRIK